MSKTLYLLPVPISEAGVDSIPPATLNITRQLDTFIVERAKTARAYLKLIQHPKPQSEINVIELPKHESINSQWIDSNLIQIEKLGLMSESGTPCIADPGNLLVHFLRLKGWIIRPMGGPNSIILSLMASGLNGQQFTFHGYLPVHSDQLNITLFQFQKNIHTTGASQIFIETPYRNQSIFKSICQKVNPDIWLCIARDLTGNAEQIDCQPIRNWKKQSDKVQLEKIPTIFILGTPFFK
jgi:16S rRNA (cytidine1402-2'-O)-methyltransferase